MVFDTPDAGVGSIAVIGRPREDGGGAIDLLGQHGARQGVRPGLRSQRQGFVRGLEDGRVEAVGAADDEGDLSHAVVAQARQPLGEGARGSRRSALIAGDEPTLGLRQQRFALGRLAGLAALNLDDGDGTQADRAARGGGALGVVEREGRFGGAPQASDAEQRDPQFAAARLGGSTDQIFSML
jgi:hypothetical protein